MNKMTKAELVARMERGAKLELIEEGNKEVWMCLGLELGEVGVEAGKAGAYGALNTRETKDQLIETKGGRTFYTFGNPRNISRNGQPHELPIYWQRNSFGALIDP